MSCILINYDHIMRWTVRWKLYSSEEIIFANFLNCITGELKLDFNFPTSTETLVNNCPIWAKLLKVKLLEDILNYLKALSQLLIVWSNGISPFWSVCKSLAEISGNKSVKFSLKRELKGSKCQTSLKMSAFDFWRVTQHEMFKPQN